MRADYLFDVWLRNAMAKRTLSAPTLVKRLNALSSTIADWLQRRTTRPDGDIVVALAKALGVTIAELRRALDGS
jgi:transcriptional regulator with XRE-family HTH domain